MTQQPSGLPPSTRLPVEHLAASFNNVTNSYKFYWFLAILEHIKEEQTPRIAIDTLLARMVSSVWYPTNYFRLSFGKQDRLGQIALGIKAETNIPDDAPRHEIIETATACMQQKSPLQKEIRTLGRYVPYRFLRPFFSDDLKKQKDSKINTLIQQLADSSFSTGNVLCLYRIHQPDNTIEIHPLWFAYLQKHLAIVTGFCHWHLLNYLQKNNPNVPNIAAKLSEPAHRDLKMSRRFWRMAFTTLGSITCIYSGETMSKENFSIDHFLPWRFVTHDQLWNLVPTPKRINSAKRDQLPDLDCYFEGFAHLQYKAVQTVAASKKERLVEDYILLFKHPSVQALQAMSYTDFKHVLYDTIAPQIQIARNMGFTANWKFSQ